MALLMQSPPAQTPSEESPTFEAIFEEILSPEVQPAQTPKAIRKPFLIPDSIVSFPAPAPDGAAALPIQRRMTESAGGKVDFESAQGISMPERWRLSSMQSESSKVLLEQFDVKNFEYKVETETRPGAQGFDRIAFVAAPAARTAPDAVPDAAPPPPGPPLETQVPPALPQSDAAEQFNLPDAHSNTPARLREPDPVAVAAGDAPAAEDYPRPTPVEPPAPVYQVRAVIDPPPTAPVARHVSMDIGDADTQVRVTIRERNGDLEVRFDAATETLRSDLENASPLLVNEIERDRSLRISDLDFTSFGSATESDREGRRQERPKKQVKSEAVFADLDETTYLDQIRETSKSR